METVDRRAVCACALPEPAVLDVVWEISIPAVGAVAYRAWTSFAGLPVWVGTAEAPLGNDCSRATAGGAPAAWGDRWRNAQSWT